MRASAYSVLIGLLTLSGILAVGGVLWTVALISGSPLWAEDGVAIGRVGSFVLLRGLLPATAAAVGLGVGLVTVRYRNEAPYLPVLSMFVMSVGASEALGGVQDLMFVDTAPGAPTLPSGFGELSGTLALFSLLVAIGSFIELSRSYGTLANGARNPDGRFWDLVGSRWIWVLFVVGLAFGTLLRAPLSRGPLPDDLAYVPWFAVLALCGMRLWLTAEASEEEARARATWLVHGAMGFLLGAVILRRALDGLGSGFFHVWSLPSTLGTLFAVLAVGYAVFFRGVAGPYLVLKKGSLYGVGGAAAVFLFAGLEELFTSWVVAALGLPDAVGAFLAAGVVASVVTLVRWRITRTVGRARLVEDSDRIGEQRGTI